MSGKRGAGLSVDRRELAEALGRLKPLTRKPSIPVLGCVLMRAVSRPDGDTLELTATNLDTTLSLEIACERGPGADFSVLVALAPLAAFTTQDTSDKVELGVSKGRLGVEGKTSVRIAVEDVDLFPSLPEEDGGEPVVIPSAIVAEAVALRVFRGKEASHSTAWTAQIHLLEREGRLDLCCGHGHAFFWRHGLEWPVPAGFQVALTGETSELLSELGGDASLVAGERHLRIEAEGFRLAQRRVEGGELPEGYLETVRNHAEQEGEWFDLAPIGEILPVLKAVTMEAELKAPLLLTWDGERTLASVRTDAVEAEGHVPGRFPNLKTGYPEDLIAVLKALDRVAGPEGRIEVSQMDSYFLRFRTEGALAFVSGMV